MGAAAADRWLTPVVLFVCVYVATFLALDWLAVPLVQWTGLISAAVATSAAIHYFERGAWPLGLFVSPGLGVRELLAGGLFGALLVGACATAVALSSSVRHSRGSGFPWIEMFAVYVPAVLHEELVFRGYPFQKMLRWNRPAALTCVAIAFAALHARNLAVSGLGLTNILLGGVLLGLAFERHQRLWFPIGVHLAWNLVAGPVLGHEVSGYAPATSLFNESGDGPSWLTGGDFGIEGSVWMTVAEVVGIFWLEGGRQKAEGRRHDSSVES